MSTQQNTKRASAKPDNSRGFKFSKRATGGQGWTKTASATLEVRDLQDHEREYEKSLRSAQSVIARLEQQRDELLAACILAQKVIAGSDTTGVGQRSAHAALFAAIARAEGKVPNYEMCFSSAAKP